MKKSYQKVQICRETIWGYSIPSVERNKTTLTLTATLVTYKI